MEVELDKIKSCSKCKQELAISRFSKDSRTKDGFYAWCKSCKQDHQNARNFKPIEIGEKDCITCKVTKPISEFRKAKHIATGRTGECRDCNSFREIKNKYGLSKEDWYKRLEEQNGGCAICGGLDDRSRILSVDHCHITGKVRGLLCDICNTTLGKFQDDPARFLSAAKYLTKEQ